jgi:hypothetical protein
LQPLVFLLRLEEPHLECWPIQEPPDQLIDDEALCESVRRAPVLQASMNVAIDMDTD